MQLFVADDTALLETVRQLTPGLTAQHVVTAHCTVAPESMRTAAEIVERRGARFLEAPFTGSKVAAENGQLVYYIGGDEAALKKARPVKIPAKLLTTYPDRWVLMHLKDLRKGVPTHVFTGSTDTRNDVTLGTGQVDWRPLIAAIAKTQIQYTFIEDESPTVLDQIPDSLKFLGTFQK